MFTLSRYTLSYPSFLVRCYSDILKFIYVLIDISAHHWEACDTREIGDESVSPPSHVMSRTSQPSKR
jgi:hypothetical protein